MFGKLRVWDTEHNNGVLIYLLLAEHAIEIVADRGLSRHVPPEALAHADAGHVGRASRPAASRRAWSRRSTRSTACCCSTLRWPTGAPNPNELPDRPSSLRR